MDYGTNFRAPRVDVHQFSMVPRAEIPRSSFRMPTQHKTTFNASNLIPVFIQEVVPGDTFKCSMTAFVRLATPVYPIMDNMDLESWFFFVPCRILWTHWVNFMGEQPASPTDSISYTIPAITPPAAGFALGSIYDYLGLPTGLGANTPTLPPMSALPFRAYNKIWNEWYRDQNMDNAVGYGAANTVYDYGDGPDPYTNYNIQLVRKRHDYFTSCLPWTQKGGTAVTLPLGTSATVRVNPTDLVTGANANSMHMLFSSAGGTPPASTVLGFGPGATEILSGGTLGGGATWTGSGGMYPANLYADLSTATAATINQIRLAFQTQRLLERDARAGTRYTEIIRSHFGVQSPDMRLQRPEYLGGGKTPVNIVPVPQTGGTGASGTTSPLGTLAAVGTAIARAHGFRGSFTEHGYILGLITVRSDNIYQQGLRRLFTRQTRYDFYLPVFAMLGEQAVLNSEIFAQGNASDANVFGYQERWAEMRYMPSYTSGYFRSNAATPLDAWHLANKYASLPSLNSTFIADLTSTTLARNLAGGAADNNQQFLGDFFFDVVASRPMPTYSVPGMVDHL